MQILGKKLTHRIKVDPRVTSVGIENLKRWGGVLVVLKEDGIHGIRKCPPKPLSGSPGMKCLKSWSGVAVALRKDGLHRIKKHTPKNSSGSPE